MGCVPQSPINWRGAPPPGAPRAPPPADLRSGLLGLLELLGGLRDALAEGVPRLAEARLQRRRVEPLAAVGGRHARLGLRLRLGLGLRRDALAVRVAAVVVG